MKPDVGAFQAALKDAGHTDDPATRRVEHAIRAMGLAKLASDERRALLRVASALARITERIEDEA